MNVVSAPTSLSSLSSIMNLLQVEFSVSLLLAAQLEAPQLTGFIHFSHHRLTKSPFLSGCLCPANPAVINVCGAAPGIRGEVWGEGEVWG